VADLLKFLVAMVWMKRGYIQGVDAGRELRPLLTA